MQTVGQPIQNSRVKERLLQRIASAKQPDGPVNLTKMPKSELGDEES
jgi:hypothetical protein